MSRQYLRSYRLTVVGADGVARVITGMRVTFEVEKFVYSRANTAVIRLYNTSEETRSLLQEKYTKVVLEVGYGTELQVLFTGDIRNIFQRRESVDAVVDIYAADGDVALLNSTFNKTYEPGVSMDQVIQDVAASFKDLLIGTIKGGPTSADKILGQSISGASREVMDGYAEEYNFNWEVEDGTINVIGDNEALTPDEVIVVNSATGMVGSPTLTEVGVNVTTLLNPLLAPNRLFQITSNTTEVSLGNLFIGVPRRTSAEGTYKVTKVSFTGDSREGDWLSTVAGKVYNG